MFSAIHNKLIETKQRFMILIDRITKNLHYIHTVRPAEGRLRARAHWPLCSTTCGRALWRDIYSRRKPLFSSFGEHTAVCSSSVRQAVARPRHRQSVCIHNIHVAATCRPSVAATKRGHLWLNKVAAVAHVIRSSVYYGAL